MTLFSSTSLLLRTVCARVATVDFHVRTTCPVVCALYPPTPHTTHIHTHNSNACRWFVLTQHTHKTNRQGKHISTHTHRAQSIIASLHGKQTKKIQRHFCQVPLTNLSHLLFDSCTINRHRDTTPRGANKGRDRYLIKRYEGAGGEVLFS